MTISNQQKIQNRIKRYSPGKLFILDDFIDIANRNTAKVEINKLVTDGTLIRVYDGVYQKPKRNKTLNALVPPSTPEILAQIARKNNQRIVPSEDTALNLLGLSTQVPSTYTYITDGPSRTLNIKNQRILLKHSGTKYFFKDNTINIILEAFRYLKSAKIDFAILDTISKQLSPSKYGSLVSASKNSTQKIRHFVSELGNYVYD